jgi:pSer/pThr/pTyr-binding forkhead associated (FHA) protein
MSVSRRHCQLNSNKDTLKIRDLNSRNGTYLNGKPINETAAKAGDYLKIGPLTFLIQIDGQPKEIVPPKQSSEKPTKEEESDKTAFPLDEPEAEPLADEDGSAKLELDESGADIAELGDL